MVQFNCHLTDRGILRETDLRIDRQAERQTDGDTDKKRDILAERHTDGRQTNVETGNRQAERHTVKEYPFHESINPKVKIKQPHN